MSEKKVDKNSDTFEFDATPFFESTVESSDKKEPKLPKAPNEKEDKKAKKSWWKTLEFAADNFYYKLCGLNICI